MTFKTIISISIFFCLFSIYGQKEITGRVIGEDLEKLPGITVFDKDTVEIASTDLNGYFKLELKNDTDELIFAGVGYEWASITIPKNCDKLELVMIFAGTYDYKSHRKIDRLRKKRFNKIPDLHLKAHINGIFQTKEPCYNRNFEAIKSRLDEIAKVVKLENKENKRDFKDLNIGDTVKVPVDYYSSDKIINTYYTICKHCTEKDYEKIITGKVVNKKRRKFTLEIQITKMPSNDTLIYRGKNLSIGSKFEYEMKHNNVIIEK